MLIPKRVLVIPERVLLVAEAVSFIPKQVLGVPGAGKPSLNQILYCCNKEKSNYLWYRPEVFVWAPFPAGRCRYLPLQSRKKHWLPLVRAWAIHLYFPVSDFLKLLLLTCFSFYIFLQKAELAAGNRSKIILWLEY
jgi:hypothetical protein